VAAASLVFLLAGPENDDLTPNSICIIKVLIEKLIHINRPYLLVITGK
jgi:hypothetical protein